MSEVLRIINLSKIYGNQKILDNINITIEKGDIYGLIGKNGAGKTTIMKIISGSSSFDKGTINLFNSENLNEGRQKLGCIIENPAIYPNMTAYDNIKVYNKLLGIKDNKNIIELLNKVGLDPFLKKKSKKFSLGMKQRLAIAIALVGNPEFLILDEPINGLDPIGIREVRKLLLELKENGVTIFLSSHILGEMEKVATKFAFIDDGKIIKELNCEQIDCLCKKYIKIIAKNCHKAMEILKDKFSDYTIALNNDQIHIFNYNEDIGNIYNELSSKSIEVISISIETESLEDCYLTFLEEENV